MHACARALVNKDQSTTLEGLFAAGDVTGGRRQMATAIGEGSSAGISAINWVRTHK